MALAAAAAVVVVLVLVFAWRRGWAAPVHADAVDALLQAGHLTPPDDPNVLTELARARTQELDRERLDAIGLQLLDLLATDVGAALDKGDAAAATAAWQRWQEAVAELEVSGDAKVIAQHAAIEAKLRNQLQDALAHYDRGLAVAALAVTEAWDAAPEALRKLADDVRAIVAPGDHFKEADGLELVLARAAEGPRPALAVMAAPVDATLFQRYAQDRGRTPPACADAPAPAQGCLDLATATDLSKWLSERTTHHYRVPTRAELDAAVEYVPPAPAQAWTSTCNEVRVARPRDAASRAWSGVRRIFNKSPTAQRYDVRCDGHFVVTLDGHGGEVGVQEQASAKTVVVLVREMAAPAKAD
jgi:hypothetical protein